jgi:hypothetical protein
MLTVCGLSTCHDWSIVSTISGGIIDYLCRHLIRLSMTLANRPGSFYLRPRLGPLHHTGLQHDTVQARCLVNRRW